MGNTSAERREGAGFHTLIERRQSERTPVIVRVEYSTVDSFFSDFTRDINEGGTFIETETPLSLDSEISLQFHLPGSEVPVRVTGRVVWTREHGNGEGPPGMGIEFDHLDSEARTRINQLVRHLRAAP